ncbi:MAG: cell division protein FtsZ [Maricaulaceae bacterium]|jgi:cell division protein FtsZ
MAGSSSSSNNLRPRIVVFGVGGAGGNAVANMIGSGLDGVKFVVANTDAQALERADEEHRLQLGPGITEGLGAGARPDIGRRAAEDSVEDIAAKVENAHMVFITAGMGGGTGTGAAPVIARIARDAGALTVAVVTKPFEFEGVKRMSIADDGVGELEREVDTLIVIPNQNLFRIVTEKTTIAEAFALADNVLHAGVRGVTDLMLRPGIVNLDFADVRTVMNEMGKAVMGSGEAEGPRRAAEAASAAMANPLLDDITLKGAKAVLLNITGGEDLTLFEVDEAANTVRAEIDPSANIIFGSAVEENMGPRLRVSIVATGINAGAGARRPSRPAAQGLPFADKVAAAGFTFEPAVSEAKPAEPPAAAQDANDADEEPEQTRETSEQELAANVEDAPEAAEAEAAEIETPEAQPEAEHEPEAETEARGPVHPWSEPVPDDDEIETKPARGGASPFGKRREAAKSAGEDRDIRSLIEDADAADEEQTSADASVSNEQADEEREAETVDVRRMTPEEETAARTGGFSLFGRRKRRPQRDEAKSADKPAGEEQPDAEKTAEDGAEIDDKDLEIPAFLRRQAN